MKKTLRLFATTLMLFVLSVSLVIPVPVKVEAQESTSESTSELSLPSRKDNVVTYSLKENNEEITLAFDIEKDIVRVNNKSYSIETYNKALEDQIIDSSKKSIAFYLKGYPETTKLISKSSDLLAVNSSPAPPTSGYGTEYRTATFKRVSLLFALTAGALAALIAYNMGGDMESAKRFVNMVLQAAQAAGIAIVGQSLNNDGYITYYQSAHKTVYGAVRERKRTYTVIETTTFWGNYSTYRYFWSIKPY